MGSEVTLKVEGMSCNHCVMSVTRALKEADNVIDARVDLNKKEARVQVKDPAATDGLVKAVEEAGYKASVK